MYLIISLNVEPRDFSDQTDDLDSIYIDFADLLHLSLQFWSITGITSDDKEALKSAVEAYLFKHRSKRLRNYSHMQSMVEIIIALIHQFHDELHSQLTPLVNTLGDDVKITLSRFLHKDALIRLEFARNET